MAKAILAGVGDVTFFDIATNAHILSAQTLTDSGLNMAITGEEARGGQGNALLGKYYHDSSFGLTLTDQIYDLQYLALNCGGGITAGSDVLTEVEVTVEVANQITLPSSPKVFDVINNKIFIWYKKATESEDKYVTVELTQSQATAKIITGLSGLNVGDIVCVKYMHEVLGARQFKVQANYIPSVVHAVLKIGLFRSGVTGQAYTSSNQIGELIVDIPNFQLDGAQDLGLTSSGIASVSLSGSALITYDRTASCNKKGYYAIITENITGLNEFDNVTRIVIGDSDIQLAVGEEQLIQVYAMYSDGTQPKLLDNSKLTFTSSEPSNATVGANTGIVTAVLAGTSNIEVKVTSVPTQTAYAVVTVE